MVGRDLWHPEFGQNDLRTRKLKKAKKQKGAFFVF